MDRPKFTWATTVVLILAIIYGIINYKNNLFYLINYWGDNNISFSEVFRVNPALILSLILMPLIIISLIIFLWKFFMLEKKCVVWIYLTLGLLVINNLILETSINGFNYVPLIWTIVEIIYGLIIISYIRGKKIKSVYK